MSDLNDAQSATTIKIVGSDNTGSETNFLNVDASGNLTVPVGAALESTNAAILLALTVQYKTIIDEASASITYIGKASAASTTASAVWQITRYELIGTELIKTSADGDFLFNNIWNNRAALTYT